VAPALSVTLAAQAAVAPLLVGTAGGMPAAGVPANLLAEPAAALIMSWGLTAGLLAGLVNPTLAGLLHVPTSALLWWVEGVARHGADLPLGEVGPVSLGVAAIGGATAVAASRRGRRGWASAGWSVVLLVVLVLPAVAALGSPPPRSDLAGVGTLWRTPVERDGAVLVLAVGARPADVLEHLRREGVHRLDLVVAPAGGSRVEALVTVVRQRVGIERVWTPRPGRTTSEHDPPAAISGEVHPTHGDRLDVGRVTVTVTRAAPTLDVSEVVTARSGAAPSPP
jgi:hypothetical protein